MYLMKKLSRRFQANFKFILKMNERDRHLKDLKVSVYPKFDHFSKKLFFAFSDRSYCNLSFKKNSKKKD